MAFGALLVACGAADDPAAESNGVGVVELTPTLFPTISAEPTATPVPPALAGTEWVLTSLDGAPIDSDVTITLSFDDHAGRGNAGCNSYGGEYFASSVGDFSMLRVEATEMDCPGEDVMETESDYLLALSHIDTFHVSGEQLELSYESGTSVLVFTSADDVASAASPSITILRT
jgi:heat shock protein HslJ